MAKRDEQTFMFDAPPEKLLEVLIDEEYQIARQKSQGALEVQVKEISRNDDRFVFEVHAKEYARGLTGVDKSKTEINVTTYDWDLKAKRGSWKHTTSQGDRVKVWGTVQVQPDGDNSKLLNDFNIEIKIPLVGGKIEKMVMKEVAKSWTNYQNVIREHLKKT
jgi:hypothetical protein